MSLRHHSKPTIKPVDDFNFINGTHLVAHMEVSYADLVKLFGNPLEGDGYKTQAEWILEVTDTYGETFYVSIYDWKESQAKESVTDWHMGAKAASHAWPVQNFVKESLKLSV